MSSRGVPFHCPYCGDEDLRPHESEDGAGPGAWECRSCLRAFSLRMLGMIPRGGTTAAAPGSEGAR
ncbi:MAG TPA: hypothetical protein VFG63_09505 [Nocardioidaceae bacterium]|nr:hypothetical protein [Nocardioidaceae bacterium]